MTANALILSGGGARAAYQVGVLQALHEIMPSAAQSPFSIVCGTSAGAINALCLAGHPGTFSDATNNLIDIWEHLEVQKVMRSSGLDMLKGAGRITASLFNGGVGRENPISLFDNSPLRNFIEQRVHFDTLKSAIDSGRLDAVCVTAMGYSSGESVSFFEGREDLKGWRRHRRKGIAAKLTVDHLMASSAIPTVFPTVKIEGEFFGDGAVRQVAPISPALHLGASKIFVIGVSSNRNPTLWNKKAPPPRHSPSMAQIIGHMFNSVFIDSLEGDVEHLERINELLELIPEDVRLQQPYPLRPVDTMIISPSKDLSKIAGRKIRHLPKTLRFFLRSTGGTARGGGSAATSYLLFERAYTNELIDLGYQDTMWEKDGIQKFFNL